MNGSPATIRGMDPVFAARPVAGEEGRPRDGTGGTLLGLSRGGAVLGETDDRGHELRPAGSPTVKSGPPRSSGSPTGRATTKMPSQCDGATRHGIRRGRHSAWWYERCVSSVVDEAQGAWVLPVLAGDLVSPRNLGMSFLERSVPAGAALTYSETRITCRGAPLRTVDQAGVGRIAVRSLGRFCRRKPPVA